LISLKKIRVKGFLFLPESLLEILDFYPGLLENPDQGSLLQFAVKRDRKDTPFFLYHNMT